MLNRVFHYAQPYVRARARIGAMPSKAQWQHIAAARDLDTLIQRMRENGLAHWVAQLPRSPDTRAIENSLRQGVTDLVNDVCRWLPARWRDGKRWMQSALTILLVQDLLHNADCYIPSGSPATLQRIATQPLAHRREALIAAGYGPYLKQDHAQLLEIWLQGFGAACPPLGSREAYAIRRIRRLVRGHLEALLDSRQLVRQAATARIADDPTQWRLREQLSERLRGLLGYETFHAGFLLLYALLELLQAERCRALLLARAHRWDAAGVV
ncbi:MAG: V-type ATPase subunit [Gammaproteobacteria bacterium]|nr:V-type ATPase subunit [Gammaproteobacteria bacterium]